MGFTIGHGPIRRVIERIKAGLVSIRAKLRRK